MMRKLQHDDDIQALFSPVDVRAYTSDVDASTVDLLVDEERSAIASMVAGRQAEFATARACARAALADYGVVAAVPKQDGGAPLWPDGIAGSISHTRGFCAAVVSQDATAIGLDAEGIARMRPAVERRILVDEERAGLDGLDDDDRRLRVATIFAAKEAFYKAHYEVDARYLGFDAVRVRIDADNIIFTPSSGAVDDELLARTWGRSLVDRGRVIVGVVINPADGVGALPSTP